MHLDAAEVIPLLKLLSGANRAGGAVSDGDSAATCAAHDLTLHTRDERAAPVYDLCGVAYELV
ncbi:hypothetical protein ACI1US_01982 [Leucobacter sp. BZR 635]